MRTNPPHGRALLRVKSSVYHADDGLNLRPHDPHVECGSLPVLSAVEGLPLFLATLITPLLTFFFLCEYIHQ